MTMLDRMRRHKGWLKWSLALVVLAFVIFYIPDFLQPAPVTGGAMPSEVIAQVEGRELRVSDFQARYFTQMQQMRAQFGGTVDEALLRQLGIEQQVLQQMIEQQVAAVEAERQGIAVSDEEVAEEILSFPEFNEGGQFIGTARYQQLLGSLNPPLTVRQFEENVRQGLLIQKLHRALTNWMAVSDEELEREYRRRNEQVRLQVVALTPETFRDEVKVTDEEIAAHYEANQAEYRVGEQRKVRYLLLDQEQARLKVSVTSSEIQRYYNDNFGLYQTPEQVRASHILLETAGKDEAEVRKQAEAILAKVKGGADFAALAKELSEDEGTKANGGDLNFFGRGEMVPEFEEVAFGLQPGETSDVVRSSFGFHIIRVTERRPEVTRPLEEVRAEIQDRLAAQKATQQVTTRANELAGDIGNAEDLNRAAAESGYALQDSEFFTQDSQIPGIGVAPQAVSAAFGLEQGEVAGPIFTARGPVFLTVSETREPYIPMLDEVRDRVREDLIDARASELSRERAGEIAAALRKGRDFAAAAKAQGVEVQDSALVTRGSALPGVGISPEVDRAAFSLEEGAISEPIPTSDGTAIIRVAERDEVTPEEFQKSRETFRAQLLSERRDQFFSSYMTKARDRMAIEINDDVLQRLMTTLQS